MRSLITLAFFALSFLTANAQYGRSVLNLHLADNTPFSLVIDGQPTPGISNVAHLENLNGGKHFIQLYRTGNFRGHGHGNGYGHTATINLFSGTVFLAANAESWATVYPQVQQVQIDEVRAFSTHPVDPCVFNPRAPQHQQPTCEQPQTSQCPSIPAGPFAMSTGDFGQLKRTIDNAGFENTRLTIFKQALNYNYFTTAQVRELMDLFWFENSKLEVAKLAYNKTIDQNNYYLVNNEFSFSSSVNELGEYIAMR